MTDYKSFVDDIAQKRDEIRLKLHLGSKDLQDEWKDLETRWHRFSEHAELARSGQELGSATTLLGQELKIAYDRFRKAL